MGISPRQIGWSNESNLLWQLSKQLDKLTGVTATNLSAIIADLATKVTNQQGVPSFRADTLANLPVAGQTGRMFVATDTYAFYRDNGLGWDLIGGPGIGTVTGSGTATQVAFWNGTSVISGSNNLFWDNANSRLGIGTSSPTALLDVRGTGVSTDFRLSRNIDPNIYLSINAPGNTPNRSTFGINGTNVMTLNASGNVGIGTTTPQSRIHALLSGNAAAGPTGTVAVFQNSTTANNSYITLLGAFDSESGIVFTDESVAFRGKIGYNNSTEFMYFQTDGSERMRITSVGNVGIGTSSPQTQLDIANGLMFGTIDAFPSATYDAAAVIAKTGSLGSAPFNNAGSIVYRARVTSTAGRSSHIFYTGSPSTERMRLDESGNLGLGVTPSAWSNFRVIQGVGTSGNSAIAFNNSGGLDLVYNTFYNGTNFIYLTTGNLANRYTVEAGTYKWYTAPSGTAGNVISFTQAMTLDASGRLGIGLTNPAQRFVVRGQNGNSALEFDNKASNTEIVSYDRVASAYRDLYLHTSSASPTMVLNTSGNVGVGIVPTAYLGFVSSAAGISLHTNSTSGAAGLNFYENSSGRFSLRTLNGTAGLSFYDSFNGTERMRITSGGNVGIGTTTPQSILDITAATPIMTISASTNTVLHGIEWKAGTSLDAFIKQLPVTGEFRISNGRSAGWGGFITFYTDTSERMRLTSAGELLINTTSDAGDYKLQVNGNSYLAGSFAVDATSGVTSYRTSFIGGIYKSNTGGGSNPFISTNNMIIQGYTDGSAARDIDFVTGVTPASRLYINTSGNVGIGTTSPAQQLEIKGAAGANTTIQITSNNSNDFSSRIFFADNVSQRGYIAYSNFSNFLAFGTNSAEVARFTSAGELLINTTTDAGDYKLQVNGNTLLSGTLQFTVSGSIQPTLQRNGSSGGLIVNTTATASAANLFEIQNNGVTKFNIVASSDAAQFAGSIKTAAPSGGTAKPFKIGAAAVVTPTSPNRTIEIEIDGTTYYLTAKTTND